MPNSLFTVALKTAALACAGLLGPGISLTEKVSQVEEVTVPPVLLPSSAIQDPNHHAVFGCLIRNQVPVAPGQPTTFRLFMDSGGDIYPEAKFLPATDKELRFPEGEPNHMADLQWYFDRPTNQTLRDKLFAAYKVGKPQVGRGDYGYDNVAWDSLRRVMAKRLAGKIDQATNHGSKPLVVLVHGYNVANYEHAVALPCGPETPTRTEPYYATIRKRLLNLRPELGQAVWLEVYWDGLQNNELRIWWAAQESARYAGLGLREVLRQLDAQTPIQVFTHSAGGLVISQTLWNNNAFDDPEAGDGRQLMQMMDSIPTPPQQDIRVGMIVPALSARAFEYYTKRTGITNLAAYRIVVGQNEKDFPINKGPAGCHRFSDTCMGSDPASFAYAQDSIYSHRRELQRVNFCVTPAGGRAPAPFLYEFKVGPKRWYFEQHDWALYFQRKPIGAAASAQPIAVEFLHKMLD